MKNFTVFVFLSLILALSIAAQTNAPLKPISGGVLNGKAKSLAKPAYPAAARAVNAEGAVSVQVLVDEEGNVASASAVSGHPLLRRAAEQAALESKFAPTMLSGQSVKVSGVITYNFVGGAAADNWVKTGYDLAGYEKFATVNSYSLNSMTAKFPADWTTEREQLKQLQNLAQNENPTLVVSSVKNATVMQSDEKTTETVEKTPEGIVVKKMTVVRRTDVPSVASPEQISIAQNLTASLQSRLGSDPKAAWQFNLGIALGRTFSNVRDQTDPQSLLDALRQQIAVAPNDVAPEFLANANKIVALLESKERTPEQRQQVGQLLSSLFRN